MPSRLFLFYLLDFIYDENGNPMLMRKYLDEAQNHYLTYRYVINGLGDVVKLMYGSTVAASYTYDAWGNLLTSNGSAADLNPLRYRGYYYDTETGFYYLQSRYYDPAVKRFLNADVLTYSGSGFLGYNMFAYCGNDPVTYSDRTGKYPVSLLNVPFHAKTPSTGLGGQPVEINGTPYNYVTSRSAKGELEEYWFDQETDTLQHSRHHSNHGNPKEHNIPHDHDWFDDDNNHHRPGPPTAVNTDFIAPQPVAPVNVGNNNLATGTTYILGGMAGGYVIYQGIKWIIATLTAPYTGGISWEIAAVTP